MGCGNPREKIEDELLKAKFERNQIQYERQRQMQLLKELDGTEYKSHVIPNYEESAKTNEDTKNKPPIKSRTLEMEPKRSRSLSFKKSLINRQKTNSKFIKRKKSMKEKTIKEK